MDFREACAVDAMKYIKDNYTIGLGAERSIQSLINCLSREVKKDALAYVKSKLKKMEGEVTKLIISSENGTRVLLRKEMSKIEKD